MGITVGGGECVRPINSGRSRHAMRAVIELYRESPSDHKPPKMRVGFLKFTACGHCPHVAQATLKIPVLGCFCYHIPMSVVSPMV